MLQSLGFDLIVYAPYRALDGFVNDVEVSGESTYQLLHFICTWMSFGIRTALLFVLVYMFMFFIFTTNKFLQYSNGTSGVLWSNRSTTSDVGSKCVLNMRKFLAKRNICSWTSWVLILWPITLIHWMRESGMLILLLEEYRHNKVIIKSLC